MSRKLAAIDIGTNTLLMLVAEVSADGSIRVIDDFHEIARLGENLGQTCKISDLAEERAAAILDRYLRRCDELGVDEIKVCATSALREAQNGPEVKSRLEKSIGCEIGLISGEREAELSFLGAVDTKESAIVVDIGGGSTEIIYGHSGRYIDRRSFPIGAVKLTERFIPHHPPNFDKVESIREYIYNEFDGFDFGNFDGYMIAVAGTPTTMAQISLGLLEYDDDKIEGYVLEERELIRVIQILLNSSVDDIVEKHGVHPRRADLITCGALLLHEIMKLSGKSRLIVSAKGLRYGILKSMIK